MTMWFHHACGGGRAARWLCGGLLALAAAGCASRGGIDEAQPDASAGVGQRMIMPTTDTRYELAPHQGFVFPRILANDSPAFPAHYRPPSPFSATLCVSLAVGEDGEVRNVHLVGAPGCIAPEEAPEPLGTAVLEAVAAWEFEPALLCEYPDAATRNRDWNGGGCTGAVSAVKPVPVTLAWAFTFELQQGQARVSNRRSSP